MNDFIAAHSDDNVNQLALQRSRFPHFTDEEWRWILQQIDGRQRMRSKLPEIAAIANWWWPVHLSLEQSSSEQTARYKSSLINRLSHPTLIDITGGMGIDCYYMSAVCAQAYYIERNEELCRLAAHNYAITQRDIKVINDTYSPTFDLTPLIGKAKSNSIVLYADPARRNQQGGKVFKLEDCEPDITAILPQWKQLIEGQEGIIMLKLSPMIDISACLASLAGLTGLAGLAGWNVHVVAVKNEVKEVLLTYSPHDKGGLIEAVDLADGMSFEFTQSEENQSESHYAEQIESYLYEPNAALLKAGAYKIVGQRMGVKKLGINTHLYTSEQMVKNWPGRVFRVMENNSKNDYKGLVCNVLTRNYVLGADTLRKQLKVKDGGNLYVIGTRIGTKPVLIKGECISNH